MRGHIDYYIPGRENGGSTTEPSSRNLLIRSAAAFSLVSFASYFDVWSHRNWFVGVDPWYNPAHLLLYGGYLVLVLTAYRDRRSTELSSRLVRYGLIVALAAAAFNEFWHRVLLFGNPLPEPFPVEPPHALLAVGLFVASAGALASCLKATPDDWKERMSASMLAGSLWLIIAGSFFYVGAAYGNFVSYFLAILVASFSSAVFLRFVSGVAGKFGYAALAYLWFLAVNYVFFVSLRDGLPLGIGLVVVVDYLLSTKEVRTGPFNPRLAAMFAIAVFYGLVYYPLLPSSDTLIPGPFLLASIIGVSLGLGIERAVRDRLTPMSPSR